ncbi:unnamed protein product [Phytomonas sp. Hart1]|nr:unnamed protein product [Phytomonas sp. Hart1]|eukprot:CCW69382.1 unnamed protein product [Phytomonas sp. isolate Hart1]
MAWHACTDHSHIALSASSITSNEWPNASVSTETSGSRFCLSCFQYHIPSMYHIELLINVKLLTGLLGQFHVPKDDGDTLHSPFHGAFVQLRFHFLSHSKPLLEVVETLMRRVCSLNRDKHMVALTTCLKKLIVDFTMLLIIFQEPLSVLPPKSSFESSKVTILGMSINEEPSLGATEQYLEEIQPHYASRCSLSHLVVILVRLLQDIFSSGKNSEKYHCLLLISDMYESCAALRAASCDYVVDFLRLYTTEAFSRESSRTLEVYLYLLHQLFMESRQRPDFLENLSKTFLLLSSSLSAEPKAPLPPQLPVFISNLCATIENHSGAPITIRNALTLMHFVVFLETTSEVVFGDPSDPAFALAIESTLHHVVPLILHPNTEVGLLACDTVRLLIKRQSSFGISKSTREWIMDLALEGIQLASKPSAAPLIGLLNTLCSGCCIHSDEETALESTTGANPNALGLIIQLSGFANDAFQDAINGNFLQQYVQKNTANVDTYAEQILRACGGNSALPFRGFLRLLYLVSGMASDVAAIRPEVASQLVQHTLRQLEGELTSSSSTAASGMGGGGGGRGVRLPAGGPIHTQRSRPFGVAAPRRISRVVPDGLPLSVHLR